MGISNAQDLEVNVVGSNTFGRYVKISDERTVNMYISDNWLVNYAGFKIKTSGLGEGRGLFNSIRGNFLIAVLGNTVYRYETNFVRTTVGTINTTSGDVYIDENLSRQICIVDGVNAYIYNYQTPGSSFTTQILNVTITTVPPTPLYAVTPGYVAYHNGRFLIASAKTSPNSFYWYVFETDPASSNQNIKFVTRGELALQTKPDFALAVKRLPGKGNNVIVFGTSVAEIWTQVGGVENYRRVQSFNIDSGATSISTIAANEDIICWLARNEKNPPFIMITEGSQAQRISSDGIDHVMDQIQFPEQSTAFLYRHDGHLFYHLTFYNPADNLTLIYDHTNQKFFTLTDENLNYHPARQISFFSNSNYFISINDGSIYEMSTDLLTYNYDLSPTSQGFEIPRIRVCKSIRQAGTDIFRVGEFSLMIEQGVTNYLPGGTNIPRVDMSFSDDGNQAFSNVVSKELNSQGNYRNRLRWQRMGAHNEFTIQLRFYGLQRFLCGPAVARIY